MLERKKFKPYKILIYAALILFALSILIPIVWVFMASLKSETELMSGNPFALPQVAVWENFTKAWTKARMGDYLFSSGFVTAAALFWLLLFALPASYALARFKFVGRKFLNTLFMAGLFININYIALPIFLMFFDLERALGLKQVFLNNRLILSIVYAASSLPFTIYLLTSYFRTIPKDYEEAASIDGSGYWQTMIRIMFPMAKPSIITVIMFQFLSFWNEYVLAFTFLDKENATLPVGVRFLMADSRSQSETGVMYAGLVIVMVPVLLLYIAVQKKILEGMNVGGLKG